MESFLGIRNGAGLRREKTARDKGREEVPVY
jgi:hypothetical protein